jgi:hypothetical protein
LRPTNIWKKGDERRTPKGNKVGGVREDSRCMIDFKLPLRQPLPEKFIATLALLKPHRAILRKLSSSGGTISLYIGWFCDENTGVTLDAQIFATMADLRIAVELFIYLPDKPE